MINHIRPRLKDKENRFKSFGINYLRRQVPSSQRMIEKIDNQVTDLKRIQIGALVLPSDLKEGEFKEIELKDIFS